MGAEDKCAYPRKKSLVDGVWTCGRCPLDKPYARYDATQDDLTVCVSYSECAHPEVTYFAELEESFPVCLASPTRFDFKSNGVNVTLTSRAVSLLNGKRHVAEVTEWGELRVRLETENAYLFSEGGVDYVRAFGGRGFVLRKLDGRFYRLQEEELQSRRLSEFKSAKRIAKVDGDLNTSLVFFEDGTFECGSDVGDLCERARRFLYAPDGRAYRRFHEVSFMDDSQIALKALNGSIAYASLAESHRYDNLSQFLRIGSSAFYLYHNQSVIQMMNGEFVQRYDGVQQILADGGVLYAVVWNSTRPDVGLVRLNETAGALATLGATKEVTRRVGEYRSFRFEWNENLEMPEPCLEYTYEAEPGRYICQRRNDPQQEVDHGVITGECKNGFAFTLEKCVCDRVINLDGTCIDACPVNQESREGRCSCANGFTLVEETRSCECLNGHLSTDYLKCIPNCAEINNATPVPGSDNVCRPCSVELDGGDYWEPQEQRCVAACRSEEHTSELQSQR